MVRTRHEAPHGWRAGGNRQKTGASKATEAPGKPQKALWSGRRLRPARGPAEEPPQAIRRSFAASSGGAAAAATLGGGAPRRGGFPAHTAPGAPSRSPAPQTHTHVNQTNCRRPLGEPRGRGGIGNKIKVLISAGFSTPERRRRRGAGREEAGGGSMRVTLN